MSARRAPDSRGLTLIELVLTLTILAVAGALVAQALSGALRAWNGGMQRGREQLVARIVVERVSEQLRAALPAAARRGEEETLAFDAGEERLRFVTPAAGAAPMQVSYQLEGQGGERHLVYREHPWPDKDFFGASAVRREEQVPEIALFRVELERADVPQGEDPVAATGMLPQRVVLEIGVHGADGGEGESYRVTVPILAGGAP